MTERLPARAGLLAVVVALFVLGFVNPGTADDLKSPVELAVTGGMSDGPGYADWAPGVGAGLEVGPSFFHVTGALNWIGLTKSGTPGGHQISATVGGKVFVGRFFVVGGFNHNDTDQTIWTKTVQYAYGGGGFRWNGKTHRGDRPVNINEASFTYWRETYSTYANDTQVYRFTYSFDHRLGASPWTVRLTTSVSGMKFNDNPYPDAAKRQGTAFSAAIGLGFRP